MMSAPTTSRCAAMIRPPILGSHSLHHFLSLFYTTPCCGCCVTFVFFVSSCANEEQNAMQVDASCSVVRPLFCCSFWLHHVCIAHVCFLRLITIVTGAPSALRRHGVSTPALHPSPLPPSPPLPPPTCNPHHPFHWPPFIHYIHTFTHHPSY